MSGSVLPLVRCVHEGDPGSVEALLSHPRIKEIVRVRAHKARPFPWERITDRCLDAQRAVWEVASSIDKTKASKLKTDGVTLGYLSGGIRNRLFRQIRTDLNLKEITVIDESGRKRFELRPRIVRAPYDLALAQIDPLADPYQVIARREGVLEVLGAVERAPMSLRARQVLELRLRGMTGRDIARKLGRTPAIASILLKEARQAVRDHLWRIRSGGPPFPGSTVA